MKQETIKDILTKNSQIYAIPDDRLYSVLDLLYYNQHFFFKYQKSAQKAKIDIDALIVSLEWFLALINRYHLDLEAASWKRYPFKCPFCMDIPCSCQTDAKIAQKTGRPPIGKPATINDWQKMLEKIYPADNIDDLHRDHLSCCDDLNHRIRLFMSEKEKCHFENIERLSADYFIAYLRLANVLKIDLAKEINQLFKRGCYVCHQSPCICNFK